MNNFLKLFIFFIFVLILQVNCQDTPQIIRRILPEIKRQGETGLLRCTISRQGSNKVYWKKGTVIYSTDEEIELDDRKNPTIKDGLKKFEVEKINEDSQGNVVTYIFIVRNLNRVDSGTYTCEVQVLGQQSVSLEGRLEVMVPPSINTGSVTTQTVKEGEDIRLTCTADGYPDPKIKWSRTNGRALPIPGGPFSFAGDTLELKNITRDARGVYTCVADNDVRPFDTYYIIINVEFKPIARPVQTTYGQAADREFDITIECRIAGNPEPVLEWSRRSKDGAYKRMIDDERHKVYTLISYGQELSISEFWFQLYIENVRYEDFGYYRCTGTNRFGNSTAQVFLYETSECQGSICPEERYFDRSVSSTVKLNLYTLFIMTILISIITYK